MNCRGSRARSLAPVTGAVNGIEEANERAVTMTLHTSANNRVLARTSRAASSVSCAVALVVMGDGAAARPRRHRQARLGSVAGLDWRPFVDRADARTVGRIDIEPDKVTQFTECTSGLLASGRTAERAAVGDGARARSVGTEVPLVQAACGHQGGGAVGCLDGRRGSGQRSRHVQQYCGPEGRETRCDACLVGRSKPP